MAEKRIRVRRRAVHMVDSTEGDGTPTAMPETTNAPPPIVTPPGDSGRVFHRTEYRTEDERGSSSNELRIEYDIRDRLYRVRIPALCVSIREENMGYLPESERRGELYEIVMRRLAEYVRPAVSRITL